MSTLASRLRKAMSDAGMSQSELARRINVKPQSIQYLCSGKATGTTHAVAIATTLHISPYWLLEGKEHPEHSAIDVYQNVLDNQGRFMDKLGIDDQSKPDPYRNLVPLISWVQAGNWSEVIDNFQPGDADEFYPCPEKHSKSTFALTVIGESMATSFVPGEIIYIDPEVSPESGSYVVVRQNGDQATFKQLMFDGEKKYLKALNPDWPNPIIEMLPDAIICGVCIGSYRKRN